MFPMKLSWILLTFEVSDMERISVVIDLGGCTFGIGVTCAFFQSVGILLSDSDLLNMAHSGGPMGPAKSLNTQLGIPSGPFGLVSFVVINLFSTVSNAITELSDRHNFVIVVKRTKRLRLTINNVTQSIKVHSITYF